MQHENIFLTNNKITLTMAVFAIPNPKKSTIVDFPIDRIKLSVQRVHNKFPLLEKNDSFVGKRK